MVITIALILSAWVVLIAGDRIVRRWMLIRLRRLPCPKCGVVIGDGDVRKCGKVTESFPAIPFAPPYGSETLIDIHCNACDKHSIVTLRGEDGSIFENDLDTSGCADNLDV